MNADDVKKDQKIEILTELIGITKNQERPIVRLIDFHQSERLIRYKPESEEISAASLTKFVEDYLNKKILPFRLEQEVPVNWDAKPVKVLTAKNFNQIAKNESKAVLVNFCNFKIL